MVGKQLQDLADLYASSLGLWCFVVVLGSDDAIAHMLCTAVTIGYTAASAGRNYARPWIIQRHIVFACAPLALALVLHGDAYYSGLGLLLALFFIGLKYINLSLQCHFRRCPDLQQEGGGAGHARSTPR